MKTAKPKSPASPPDLLKWLRTSKGIGPQLLLSGDIDANPPVWVERVRQRREGHPVYGGWLADVFDMGLDAYLKDARAEDIKNVTVDDLLAAIVTTFDNLTHVIDGITYAPGVPRLDRPGLMFWDRLTRDWIWKEELAYEAVVVPALAYPIEFALPDGERKRRAGEGEPERENIDERVPVSAGGN